MRRAIFPGTFDPFTIGHYSIVTRALTFMDEVTIGIGINENKNTYFPIEKRVEMIQKLYKNEPGKIALLMCCFMLYLLL